MNCNKLLQLALAVTLSITSINTFAKKFSNGYIEFELPPKWQCVIEGSEWVCQSENADRKKEAIIILAAKKRGAQDTLGKYQAYLKKEKMYQLPGSKMQRSEPKSVTTQTINGTPWIDALHLASEVPGFYTRYLAAVKADIGVAVTLSVTKNLYNAYKGIFDNIIDSLRVFRQDNKKLANLRLGSGGKAASVQDTTFVPVEDGIDIGAVDVSKRKKSGGGDTSMLLFIILGVIGAFVMLKLKGKKKSSSKKKKKK
jgi:hypothetical protein